MTPTYMTDSIMGTQLDPAFNKTFRVEMGTQTQPISGAGWLHPTLESPNENPGAVDISIGMPNPSHPIDEVTIEVEIATDTLGCFSLRPVNATEIKALRKAWPTIRQDIEANALDTYGQNDSDYTTILAALDRAERVFTAKQVKIYSPNPDFPNQQRMMIVT